MEKLKSAIFMGLFSLLIILGALWLVNMGGDAAKESLDFNTNPIFPLTK